MNNGGMNEEGDVYMSRKEEPKKVEHTATERKREREADENRGQVIILSTSFPCGLIQ